MTLRSSCLLRDRDEKASWKVTFVKPLVAWVIYDWANNSFATIVLTFVFAAYFSRQVAPEVTYGTALWGTALGVGGIFVAVLAPILGATADQMGRTKAWIAVFTAVCVLATALLWFIEPSPSYMIPALLLVVVGMIGSEFANIFYNAMLPRLADAEHLGRWSGWAWSAGYAGGLACLVAALLLLVQGNSWISLDRGSYQHVRATCLLAAAWYAVFALPLFLKTPDIGPRKSTAVAFRDGLRQLRETFRSLRRYRNIVRFLIARLIYIDGLGSLFVFGGVYAAGTFAMNEQEVLAFGIAINATAGLGALGFAWVDDWIGGKPTIMLSLLALIVFGSALLLIESQLLFWILALSLGLFVGPVQAASRSFMARISPAEIRNEAFGFYAFSGKATAFVGALLVGWLTQYSESQRIGMSVIIVLFMIGFLLMMRVPSDRSNAQLD
ncbi:MAG TPA: MFS transporter [Candidatus Binatia bacterium]|nr:MFS transporter [Candidatus Binatia bacterium]